MKASLLLVIMAIATCAFSAEVISNPLGVEIKSENDLAHLILAHLGFNSPSTSDKIKQVIKENKMSVLNAALQVVLLVTTGLENKGESFSLTKQFLDTLGQGADKIQTHIQVGKSVEEVEKYVEEILKGKIVQHINVKEEQVNQIKSLLSTSSRRVLVEQKNTKAATQVTQVSNNAPPSSYTFKFFFILVFIIVTFGILAAIAGMENKKDTLLYAKFIADVGR